jgi:hypothetical protein
MGRILSAPTQIYALTSRFEAGVQGHAAVDVEVGAGDVVGVIAREPHGCLADVAMAGDAPACIRVRCSWRYLVLLGIRCSPRSPMRYMALLCIISIVLVAL